MRIRFLFLTTLLCSLKLSYAQEKANSKLALMQGIWECLPDTVSYSFRIIKENKCLSFSYFPESPNNDFQVSETIVGFQNQSDSTLNADEDTQEISVDSIKADGLYFTEIIDGKHISEDGLIAKPYFFVPYYFHCDEEMMSICGGKLFDYERIPKLTLDVIAPLYYCGKKDKRDYINEYMGIKVVELVKSCAAYEKPEKRMPLQLKQGAILVIVEYMGKWAKVEYGVDSFIWIDKRKLDKAIHR